MIAPQGLQLADRPMCELCRGPVVFSKVGCVIMFPRITTRNMATTSLVIWGLALISWYSYNVQNRSRSDNIHPNVHKKPSSPTSTSTEPPNRPATTASTTQKTVIWKERNPYTKFIMEAVNVVIGRNEDWKVHAGCSDEIINYASIPLAVNTLTLTTALVRYVTVVSLSAEGKFKSWYKTPRVQRILREVIEVVKHTIDIHEM